MRQNGIKGDLGRRHAAGMFHLGVDNRASGRPEPPRSSRDISSTKLREGTEVRNTAPPHLASMTVSVVIPPHNKDVTIRDVIASCRPRPIARPGHRRRRHLHRLPCRGCSQGRCDCHRGQGGSKAAAQNMAIPLVTSDLIVALDGDAT
jgi:cellulose synthase/poly-beta-1,6-N-acetylglucosamine synthase-like glycosyltransferase